MIASDDYLGSMTADELAALHPKRRTVTRATFDAARDVWRRLPPKSRRRCSN